MGFSSNWQDLCSRGRGAAEEGKGQADKEKEVILSGVLGLHVAGYRCGYHCVGRDFS